MPASILFTDAMALTEVSRQEEDGGTRVQFDGALNEHWTIGPKVHGGAMLALCAKAARIVIERSDSGKQPGGQQRGDSASEWAGFAASMIIAR